jgi:hypothetical protein
MDLPPSAVVPMDRICNWVRLDLSIAKLLPQGAEISRKVTSAYRITDVEVEQLAQQVVENLKR